jgi:lactoylglutathione lyase
MKAEINLITIWTDKIDRMRNFYNQVLGFRIKNDLGNYVEFENNGVRFAICMGRVKKISQNQSMPSVWPSVCQ